MTTFNADGSVDLIASENLTPGLVHVWDDGGAFHVRQADQASGLEAHGFILYGALTGNEARIYFGGIAGGFSGLTGGPAFLGNAGQATPVAGVALAQAVGVAISATQIAFLPKVGIVAPTPPADLTTEGGTILDTEDGKDITTEG